MRYAALSLVFLAVSAWMLSDLCFKLLPVAIIFLVGYSYTKRFTWGCHFFLGITDGLAPMVGWIAVTGDLHLGAWLLGGIVAVWIAGFDIIYACKDVKFDTANRLHSVPVRFGVGPALKIARVLHVITILLFLILPQVISLGWMYYIGVLIVAILLIIEHRLIKPSDMSGFLYNQ